MHTDQRGVHRPQGAKCDIGAFELKPGEVATSAAPTSGIAGPVRASSSGPFVNCDRGGDLQQHLDSAPSGTAVLIKGTCHGNFVISGRSLTLKGYPSATLDGMDTGSTLQVTTNDTLHLKHLTVTAGMAQSGAGVYSKGSVTLRKTKVMGNEAASSSGAVGGGIYTVANLTLFSSSISSNKATAVGSGVAEAGGVFTGNLTTTGSVVSGNRTTAALGSGTPAVLDTIYAGGKVSITGSRLTGNRVGASGDGPTVGAAALGVEGPGPVSLEGDVVSGNMAAAVSDTSSDANAGRTIGAPTAPVTVSESKISGNLLSADGGANAPGNAQAGGVYADKLTLRRSIVQRNIAIARGTDASVSGSAIWGNAVHLIRSTVARNSGQATSSSGPASSDGTIYGNTVSMSRSTVDRNTLVARSSGANASAQGGGLDTSVMAITAATISRNIVTAHAHTEADGSAGGILESSGTIKNSTVALNSVRATSPKSGGNTFALGGGFFIPSPGHLVDDTVAGNTVSGSGGTVTADGGGIAVGGLVTLEGTIVATNKAPKGPDCSGIPTSKGHNLIGKAAGCPFTKKTGDRANVKPLLGTLAYNGGPTQTIGIKTTSPAHNAVPTSACPLHSDQRGVRRPQGPRCDIGAFELKPGETVPSA